jgi:hypothetical protein
MSGSPGITRVVCQGQITFERRSETGVKHCHHFAQQEENPHEPASPSGTFGNRNDGKLHGPDASHGTDRGAAQGVSEF